MCMQHISVSTLLLFGTYLAAVDELSILTFKPKIFPYFAGSTRKRRQIIFTKFLAGSPFAFTMCTVYTFLIIFFALYYIIIHCIGETANSHALSVYQYPLGYR